MNRTKHASLLKKIILALVPGALCGAVLAAEKMDIDFRTPPDSARPGVYWYFLNGNLNGREMTAERARVP